MEKRLHRSSRDRILGGVCAGLGEYFDIDPVLVRVVFVLLALAQGIGFLIYVILWIVMPKESEVGAPPETSIRSNFNTMGQELWSAFQTTAGPQGGAPAAPSRRRPAAAFLVGAALVVLGAVLLLDNLNLVWWLRLSQLWPLILIAAGIALLLGRGRRR